MVLAINFKRIECHCCCCMATELCSKTTAFVSFRVSSQNCDLPYENAITLRCQLCGGLTADLPPSISFDGIDHPKLSTTQDRCKICLKNGWYMRGKCGVHLHCNTGAVYFDMYHTNIWLFFFFLERFCKNGYFLKHSRFRNQNQHFRFLSYLHIENTKMHFFVCNVPTWEQELSHSIISKHVENFSYIVVTSNYKNNMLVLLS